MAMLAGRPGRRNRLGTRSRAVVLVLMVMLAACGRSAGLDPPKASTVAGVPIPQTATPGGYPIDPTLPAGASYLVPGITFADLRAWYDRQLPIGQPFGEWAWCDELDGADYVVRTYGDSQHKLEVSIIVGASDGGPGVAVGVSPDDDCHILPG
jgi:hypothetical protein